MGVPRACARTQPPRLGADHHERRIGRRRRMAMSGGLSRFAGKSAQEKRKVRYVRGNSIASELAPRRLAITSCTIGFRHGRRLNDAVADDYTRECLSIDVAFSSGEPRRPSLCRGFAESADYPNCLIRQRSGVYEPGNSNGWLVNASAVNPTATGTTLGFTPCARQRNRTSQVTGTGSRASRLPVLCAVASMSTDSATL